MIEVPLAVSSAAVVARRSAIRMITARESTTTVRAGRSPEGAGRDVGGRRDGRIPGSIRCPGAVTTAPWAASSVMKPHRAFLGVAGPNQPSRAFGVSLEVMATTHSVRNLFRRMRSSDSEVEADDLMAASDQSGARHASDCHMQKSRCSAEWCAQSPCTRR